jgi:hypothetical protein
MAKTHMLGLEKIQYRAFRIALGLMGFTLNNCLGGVVVFYRLGQRERLGVLWALHMGCCIKE